MPSESESVSHFSLGLLLVAGGLQLVLQVESLVAVDELVGDGVPHRPARRRLDRAVDRPVALGRRGADRLCEHTARNR